MRRVALTGVVLAAVVLTGCGDGDEPTAQSGSVGSEGAVGVVAEDIGFGADTYEADAGTVEFAYRNEGSLTHTLLIEDVDGFKLEVASDGDTDNGSVGLDPGSYILYCDVPGHRQAGMEATLEVR